MMWLGMLRVFSLSKTLGPLVIIFIRMMEDAASFLLMLLFVIFAFAVCIDGALPQAEEEATWEQCVELQEADDHGIVARCINPLCNLFLYPHLA